MHKNLIDKLSVVWSEFTQHLIILLINMKLRN